MLKTHLMIKLGVGHFDNVERSVDDGGSGTGLDISITRVVDPKKVIAAVILSDIAELVVVITS